VSGTGSPPRPPLDVARGDRLAALAQEADKTVRVRREKGAELPQCVRLHAGTTPVGLRPPCLGPADVPIPLPVQNEAREGTEPEEAPDARERPGRRFGELVEREDEHLGGRERVQPAAQLGLVERLRDQGRPSVRSFSGASRGHQEVIKRSSSSSRGNQEVIKGQSMSSRAIKGNIRAIDGTGARGKTRRDERYSVTVEGCHSRWAAISGNHVIRGHHVPVRRRMHESRMQRPHTRSTTWT